MKLKEIVPELVVESVERSINFFKNVLNFKVTAQVPESGTPTWAELVNGLAHLMIQSREETQREIPGFSASTVCGTMLLVFRFEGQDIVRDLWARSAEWEHIIFPLRETDYGTIEFCITDPDDHVLIFSSKIA